MIDTPKSIIRSAVHFFFGTLLSRFSGLFRDIAMAYAFGTDQAVAAFLVAFRFAHLFRRLFGEGALQTAFIPHFENRRKIDSVGAYQFFIDTAISLTAFLTGLILLSLAGLYLTFLYGNSGTGTQEIIWLTLLMTPSLLFICLFGLNASLLQCEKSYFISSTAPVAFNLFWIAGIFSLQHLESSQAMSWLSCFIILGCLGQWAVTLPKTIGILKKNHRSRWTRGKLFSKDVKNLIKPLCLAIFGVASTQINSALDVVFARLADSEGPAILWYAIRLQQLPLALFGIALSGALLPPLSRALNGGDEASYKSFLNLSVRRSLALMLPISMGLFLFGDRCINLLYGYGNFGTESILETTWALIGYALGLIPMTLILIFSQALYADHDYKTPSTASCTAVILNIFLNYCFIGIFNFGVGSIALATSLSSWLNMYLLVKKLKMKTSHLFSPETTLGIIKLVSTVSITSLITLFCLNYETVFINYFHEVNLSYPQALFEKIMQIGYAATVFAIFLISTSFALKCEDIFSLTIFSNYANNKQNL